MTTRANRPQTRPPPVERTVPSGWHGWRGWYSLCLALGAKPTQPGRDFRDASREQAVECQREPLGLMQLSRLGLMRGTIPCTGGGGLCTGCGGRY
jgi:hypothetical protein